jgi:hypothetical protein
MVNKGTSKVINKRTSPPRLNKSAKSLNKLPCGLRLELLVGDDAIIDELKPRKTRILKKSKTRLRILAIRLSDAILV